MNEGVSETSQRDEEMRDLGRLNDPVHRIIVIHPRPINSQAGERSSNFSQTISGAWRKLWSKTLFTNGMGGWSPDQSKLCLSPSRKVCLPTFSLSLYCLSHLFTSLSSANPTCQGNNVNNSHGKLVVG